jgi:hypothetical protein
MDDYEGPPKNWPPLGLPEGSVRALLTLIVVAVVVSNLARGREVDPLWVQTLLIAMAHYFASRRIVALSDDVIENLARQGLVEQERHPLFLPRGSIRLLIVAAFIGLAVFLYREQRLLESRALSLLGIIAAYVFGALVRTVSQWFRRRRTRPAQRLWGDLRALLVLGVLVAVAVPEFLDPRPEIRPEFREVAVGLVLFYFGVR